jgi:CheY-like chemotaxis protein
MLTPDKAILLVEDDMNDAFFLRYAFEQAGISNAVKVAEDGKSAMDYLSGSGKYADRDAFPLPSLMLLDLKLPECPGMEVLAWIREQPDLGCLIVIVLTSSADPRDVEQAYRMGARSYVVKPLTLDKRLQLAHAIKHYWLELNAFAESAFARAP